MKPYNPLRNKINTIKNKIEERYQFGTLIVIEEEMIPRTQLAKIKEED